VPYGWRGSDAWPRAGVRPGTPRKRPRFGWPIEPTGLETYEATGPVPGRCPECGATVSIELPRFGEPPVQLDLAVVHEPVQSGRGRHMVDVQSFSATGRVLLASRLLVQTRTESA
jgi:hypothetical protein